MPRKRVRDLASENMLRRHNDLLSAWAVCDNAACRQGRACRGDIAACSPKNFKRLPEDLRAWFCLYLLGKEEGLPFEETMARLAETSVADAYGDWCRQVEANAAPPVKGRAIA